MKIFLIVPIAFHTHVCASSVVLISVWALGYSMSLSHVCARWRCKDNVRVNDYRRRSPLSHLDQCFCVNITNVMSQDVDLKLNLRVELGQIKSDFKWKCFFLCGNNKDISTNISIQNSACWSPMFYTSIKKCCHSYNIEEWCQAVQRSPKCDEVLMKQAEREHNWMFSMGEFLRVHPNKCIIHCLVFVVSLCRCSRLESAMHSCIVSRYVATLHHLIHHQGFCWDRTIVCFPFSFLSLIYASAQLTTWHLTDSFQGKCYKKWQKLSYNEVYETKTHFHDQC